MHAGGMSGEGKTVPGPQATPPGEREALADERERKADQREVLADERERKADEREVLADERERKADERERKADERARAVAAEVKMLQEQSRVLIERSKALLAASGEGLQLHGVQVTPAGGHHQPRQAEPRTAARSEPGAATTLSSPATAIERAVDLRAQLSATLGVLATTEDEVARVHDALAEQGSHNADNYRQAAAKARSRAAELRDIERHFRNLNR